jgi:hypothetical protein
MSTNESDVATRTGVDESAPLASSPSSPEEFEPQHHALPSVPIAQPWFDENKLSALLVAAFAIAGTPITRTGFELEFPTPLLWPQQ